MKKLTRTLTDGDLLDEEIDTDLDRRGIFWMKKLTRTLTDGDLLGEQIDTDFYRRGSSW